MRKAKCVLCGSTKNIQRHHLIPLRKGGEDSFLNRMRLCINCHREVRKAFLEYQKELKEKLDENWTIIEVKREQKPEYIT